MRRATAGRYALRLGNLGMIERQQVTACIHAVFNLAVARVHD